MRLGRRFGRAAAALLALVIGGGFALLSLAEPLPIKALRNIIFDGYQRLAPRSFDNDMPARVIDIDDESLRRIGQWPWPRTVLAGMIDRLAATDPAVIALDIVFSEPDRTSPEVVLPLLPPSPERDALAARVASQGLTNDHAFGQALGRTKAVAGIVLGGAGGEAPVLAGFAAAGDAPNPFLPVFEGVISPLPALQPAIKGFGALNWVPEYDLVVRRVPTVLRVRDQLVPSLAVEALRVAQDASTIIIKSSNASGEQAFGVQTGVVSIKVGNVVLPTDSDGAIRLRYAGAKPQRRIPAWKVLAGEVPASETQGRILFVGSSASALADLRASPLDASIPGVEVHAEFIEHALAGSQLTRPDWAAGAEAVLTCLAALLAALVGYRFAPMVAAAIGILSFAALGFGSWRLFTDAALLIDPALPSLAGFLAFSSTSVARWRSSDSERKAVRNAFAHYLSPAMVERLSEAPERLVLGGEQRPMTLLFSDVRGFTGLAETFKGDPQGLTTLMNRLLTPLSDAITQRSGTIDKYMGDAIMAFWNAPLDVPDHAAQACAAALEMRRQLDALNAMFQAESVAAGRLSAKIDIGIGINTGACVVGNMGSAARFDYSALGDPVNIASRLEGQTSAYGVQILVGEDTELLVRDRFALLELDWLRAKGKKEPLRIFALMGEQTTLAQPSWTRLKVLNADMLAAYRAGSWAEATSLLHTLQPLAFEYPLKTYLGIMSRRIMTYAQNPPPLWDGVHDATTK